MSTEEKIIRNKVGLLKLSEMLGSVSEACKGDGLLPRQLLPLQRVVPEGRRVGVARDQPTQVLFQEPGRRTRRKSGAV